MEATEKSMKEEIREGSEVAMQRVRTALDRTDEQVRHLVATHPILTLVGAASIGYFLGRLIARR